VLDRQIPYPEPKVQALDAASGEVLWQVEGSSLPGQTEALAGILDASRATSLVMTAVIHVRVLNYGWLLTAWLQVRSGPAENRMLLHRLERLRDASSAVRADRKPRSGDER
jgi:hypothetical protein